MMASRVGGSNGVAAANGGGASRPHGVSFANGNATVHAAKANGHPPASRPLPSTPAAPFKNAKNATLGRRSAAARSPHTLRLVVLGSGGVGKSALTIMFTQAYFVDVYDPTIQDSYNKQLYLDERMWKLEVTDTAGQDEFASLREPHLRNADGFLFVFSLTSRESYEYIKRLQRYVERVKDRDNFPCCLVGAKSDLERKISHEEAESYARSLNLNYYECSAKLRQNVDFIFHELIRCIERFQVQERESALKPAAASSGSTRDESGSSSALKKRRACSIM